MNLTAVSQFSYGQLAAQAVGMACVGCLLAALLAGLLHAALHLTGAWRTRPGQGKKFSWWPAVVGVGLGALAGGWAGLQVGIGRGVVPVAEELGQQMLKDGLEQGFRRAGLTNLASLDVGQLLELVTKAEQAAVPPLELPGAERLRPQIEGAKARLLVEARVFLKAKLPQGKLASSDLLAAFWPKVFAELLAGERGFRRAAMMSGVWSVVGIEAMLALVCLVMRQTRKPATSGPPTLPKT